LVLVERCACSRKPDHTPNAIFFQLPPHSRAIRIEFHHIQVLSYNIYLTTANGLKPRSKLSS